MGAVTFRPITLAEFEELPEAEGKQEVSAGELLTMPPAKLIHGLIAHAILEVLFEYLKGKPYKVLSEVGCLLSTDPLTYRQPDISVVKRTRTAAMDASYYFVGAPEVAIEIASPSNSALAMNAKAEQYLEHGALQVWVFYPDTRTVHIHQPGSETTLLDSTQILEGGALLPDLHVPVQRFFEI